MIGLPRILTLTACFGLVGACSSPRIDDCKSAVESHLTSPASAQWGELETEDTASAFEVRGRVDSDNAFGASRRTYFVCRSEKGERVKVAFARQPFDDYLTRLREGRPILDWR